MSDEATSNPPIVALSEIGSAVAPIIYFDQAPTFGIPAGVATIALEAIVWVAVPPGGIWAERRIVAHLRTSQSGLASLKAAVAGIELAQAPPGGQAVN